MRTIAPIFLLLLVACEARTENQITPEPTTENVAAETPAAEAAEAAEAATAEPATETPTPEGPRTFGTAPSERDLIALSAIAENPDQYAGNVVKTEGEIAAVCQRMGCWMELSAEGVPPIRVPMAGHSFFLPKDVSGRHAVIEGTVALRELSEGERAHLEEEGALATANRLQITATGVVLR